MIRVMTFNVRGGLGLDGTRDTARVAAVAEEAVPDIVCFQEIHQRLPWSGWIDQPCLLRSRLRVNFVFQPNVNLWFGGYGLAIASRFGVTNVERRFLPSRGERRGALRATIAHPDGPVDLWCTHWGLSETERLGQAASMAKAIGDSPLRTIVCGDFNEPADGAGVKRLQAGGALHDSGAKQDQATYPADRPRARIDLILYSHDLCAGECRTIDTHVSDHRPVICTFTNAKNG